MYCTLKSQKSTQYERWAPEPVTFEQGEDGSSKLGLAQYKLTNWSYSEVYRTHGRVRANVSVISLHFAFHRQTGFYLLQIYVPLTLIVMCSWVTFWLRKTEKGQDCVRLSSLLLFLGANGILYSRDRLIGIRSRGYKRY